MKPPMASTTTEHTCEKCGSLYERVEQANPSPVIAMFKCEVCGTGLEYDTTAVVVRYRLIRRTEAQQQ